MSFGLYIVGYVIMIGGLVWGAVTLHIPTHWIAIGVLIMLGVAILTGVKATRHKDPVA